MRSAIDFKVAPINSAGRGGCFHADGKKHFSASIPVIQEVSDRICYEFLRGVPQRALAVKYGLRVAAIEGVIRQEFRSLQRDAREIRRAA